MIKSIECEYRRLPQEVSSALQKQGVTSGMRACARPSENNTDRVYDFPNIIDSSECPSFLLESGEINMDEYIKKVIEG